MLDIKKIVRSTLIATATVINIATSATAQGYYPNNPPTPPHTNSLNACYTYSINNKFPSCQ